MRVVYHWHDQSDSATKIALPKCRPTMITECAECVESTVRQVSTLRKSQRSLM